MKVVGFWGLHWRVSRRWLPWRRKARFDDPGNSGVVPVFDDPILGTVALVLALPALVLAVVVALELLLLLLVLPVVVLGRIVLGRRWRVEVRRERSLVWEGEAGTWAQSGQLIRRVAQDVQRGTSDIPWLQKEGLKAPKS